MQNIEDKTQPFIYFDSNDDEIYDLKGTSMNEDYIFFWNSGKVWKLDIETQILTEMGMYVDER